MLPNAFYLRIKKKTLEQTNYEIYYAPMQS